MVYDAVIFDLDGTAMPHSADATPSQRVICAVGRAREYLRLSVATGRSMSMAAAPLRRLGIVDPCVVAGGTKIVNPLNGDVIWEKLINTTQVNRIFESCSDYPYEVLVNDERVGEGSPGANRHASEPVNVIYVMSCPIADAQVIAARIGSLPDVSVAVTQAWAGPGADIHITHQHGTKEYAIRQLLAMMRVSKERTIGVGDGDNDTHLFSAVGKRIAMANATESLKAMADEICPSVDEDGLAQVLESVLVSASASAPFKC